MSAAKGIAAFVLMLVVGAACAQDFQRGLRNYQDVMAGRKKLEQLSPQERSEVIQVHRALRSRGTGEGKSAECRNAINEARDAASELADQSGRLKRCAEAEDLEEDCSSEFSRTRSAHSDYESAVSDVGSYCN